jgi:TolB-like protein
LERPYRLGRGADHPAECRPQRNGDSGDEQRLIKTLPRKGFRFVGTVREAQGPTASEVADHPVEQPRPTLTLPNKPSIAVLPFANLGSDPEQEYFADGVVEDITMALSRFPWLFVIARNSSFMYKGRAVDVKQVGRELGVRYVLEGSVRKAGNRIRIAGQLIDAETGAHLWADRFDGALEAMFDLQDHVTSSVVGAIAPKLQREEIKRARRKPTENLDAYDYYLRGLAKARWWTKDTRTERRSSSFARRSSSTLVWLPPTAWPRGATCSARRVAG